MSCFGSSAPSGDPESSKKSRAIDSEINKEAKKLKSEIKILLLGPGESGKSTIFKQMKILQSEGGGFTQEELMKYTSVIYGNCITQMKVIVTAAARLGISFESDENQERAARVSELQSTGDAWTKSVGADIKALWGDSGIKQAYDRRDSHYQLNDSASYFFENVGRFMEENYCPNEQDVLRARVRTTGVEEAIFRFDKMNFRMVDVGGQRSERRKWIHCFDGVTAVLFCTSLSEYDQTLREDKAQNRMKESLLLFDEITNSPFFQEIPFILFLNKTDLFEEKLKRVDLSFCFPDYTDGPNYEHASKFVKERFMEKNMAPHTTYAHFTCAINTDNIEFVWKAVRNVLLQNVLGEGGLI